MSSGWFADGEGDQMAFTVADYWRHYLNSVGIGMVNTMNAPPGTTGQIHKSVVSVMQEFGAAARPLLHPEPSAGPFATDCASMVVELNVAQGFNAVVSREDLTNGQRISAYTVEALQADSTWAPIAPACSPVAAALASEDLLRGCVHGLSVGAMIVDLVDRLASAQQRLRFRCLESLQDPVYVKSFGVARVDFPKELL
jgi:hypothetical protein